MSATGLTSTSDGTSEGTIDAAAGGSSTPDGSVSDAGDAVADEGATDRGATTEPTNEAPAVSKDVIFDILKNERRRRALEFLREEPTTSLSDLAEHVAALENDKPIRELTSSERKRVYVGLYQCHLPKMADAGVVDYDRSRGTIALCDPASACFVYLDIDPEEGTPGGGTGGWSVRAWLSTVLSPLARG